MAEKVQVKAWVAPDVKKAFEKFVVELHGQKYGNMSREVENALKFYTDRDRLERVDDKLDRVLTRLDEIDGSHTHKQSETVEKAERIAAELGGNGNVVLPEDDVHRATESVAGADERTIRKYEKQLKRHGFAYEHPSGGDHPAWTLEREQWIRWAENHLDNDPTADVLDLLTDYPLGFDEYDRLADELRAKVEA